MKSTIKTSEHKNWKTTQWQRKDSTAPACSEGFLLGYLSNVWKTKKPTMWTEEKHGNVAIRSRPTSQQDFISKQSSNHQPPNTSFPLFWKNSTFQQTQISWFYHHNPVSISSAYWTGVKIHKLLHWKSKNSFTVSCQNIKLCLWMKIYN